MLFSFAPEACYVHLMVFHLENFGREAKLDPFHLADVQDVASSTVLRTGVQTLAALGGGDLVLFQAIWELNKRDMALGAAKDVGVLFIILFLVDMVPWSLTRCFEMGSGTWRIWKWLDLELENMLT